MTATELLKIMPELLDAEAAAGIEAVVQYHISEPIYQVLKGGSLQVFEGEAAHPDLLVTISDDDLVRLFRGELQLMGAFMTRKLKLRGNVILAQRLVGLVDREKLRGLG